MKKILITGANGFIGSFLTEAAARRGFEVWAGVRSGSNLRYLEGLDIHLFEMDYSSATAFRRTFEEFKRTTGVFDYIIHCAGATKCVDVKDFDRINFEQTRMFADTLISLEMVPRQFIFISTLSVFGPVRESDYSEICESDVPCPNTAYGRSKLKAENYLSSLPGFPYLFFRPTGVYGPREKDYFMMAQSIQNHIDFAVGFKRQDLTFVYVKDIVQAVFRAIDRGITRRAYFLSDGRVYCSSDFSRLIADELGIRFVIRIKSPLFVLKVVSLLAEFFGRCRHRSSTLNSDKYRIMKQRNWRCDIRPAADELGYVPEYDLERGVRETIKWYKENGWL